MDLKLHIPTVEYLKFGNIYSASFEDFNYKFFPNLNDFNVLVVVWKGKFCCEKSEKLFEKIFSLDDEDVVEKIKIWLTEKYENIL